MNEQISDTELMDITIDLSYLKEFSNGDAAFEKEMLGSSMQECEEKISLLSACAADKNYQQVTAHAHAIKSIMSVVGSAFLHNNFHQIEKYRTSKEFEEILPGQLRQIKEVWHLSKQKINLILKDYNV